MALAGNNWGNLLQQIQTDFSRTDLVSVPTPLPTDLAWIWALASIQKYQPRIFMPGQSYLNWCSTIANVNLYALPVDFEDDGQIIQQQSGQNLPLVKQSENFMNQIDIQVPPVIGQAQFYCIYGTAVQLFSTLPTWQPNFNYSNVGQFYQIIDSNGNVQIASTIYGNGTSGAVPPTWATTLGATTLDPSGTGSTNGIQWTCSYVLSAPTAATQPVLRIWPWPDRAYPMTAVYQNIIPAPTNANTSNFWTVQAEAMIRYDTESQMRKDLFHEEGDAYQRDADSALTEYNWVSGLVRRQSAVGKARPCYL